MPERAAIDPQEETVRISGRVWRFDWDASTGTLSIELDGRTYRLHGITWRQKINLARAVSAGMLPAARGLLRAALGPGAAVPADEEQREVLTALAEWLTAGTDPLPLDPPTLARVTIGVCREAGFAPRDLDDMPAADIEDMWKGLGAEPPNVGPAITEPPPPATPEAPAPPTPPAPPLFRTTEGFNRIIIVPEPPPAVRPEPVSAAAAEGSLEPSAPTPETISRRVPFDRPPDIVAISGAPGFAPAPASTSPSSASPRIPTVPAPESAALPPHEAASAPAAASTPWSLASAPSSPSSPSTARAAPSAQATTPAAPSTEASAPATSGRPSAPLNVQRRSTAARLQVRQSLAESGVSRTPSPGRYRMASPANPPARSSNFSPTAPAAAPLPTPRAAEPASPLPEPPAMLPVEALEVKPLPEAAGAPMSIAAAAPRAVPQQGAAPFEDRDLIPFLTTNDGPRAATPWSADVVRRFEDDLARAAIEAGVELES
jgi:hypothetical protein